MIINSLIQALFDKDLDTIKRILKDNDTETLSQCFSEHFDHCDKSIYSHAMPSNYSTHHEFFDVALGLVMDTTFALSILDLLEDCTALRVHFNRCFSGNLSLMVKYLPADDVLRYIDKNKATFNEEQCTAILIKYNLLYSRRYVFFEHNNYDYIDYIKPFLFHSNISIEDFIGTGLLGLLSCELALSFIEQERFTNSPDEEVQWFYQSILNKAGITPMEFLKLNPQMKGKPFLLKILSDERVKDYYDPNIPF